MQNESVANADQIERLIIESTIIIHADEKIDLLQVEIRKDTTIDTPIERAGDTLLPDVIKVIGTDYRERPTHNPRYLTTEEAIIVYGINDESKLVFKAIDGKTNITLSDILSIDKIHEASVIINTRNNELIELGYLNKHTGLLKTDAQKDKPEATTVAQWALQTGQEFDELSRAICDGKTMRYFSVDANAGTLIHAIPKATHQTLLSLTDDEMAAGLDVDYLQKLTQSQDADGMLAAAYIIGGLVPQQPLPARAYAGGWIDLDDVIKKIGWKPRNTAHRRELHKRLWELVKFGERAQLIGKRNKGYKDLTTGKFYDTEIRSTVWRVLKTETPDPKLFSALNVPVRVELVVSQEMTKFLQNPHLQQYLQGADILGAIPSGKAGGAWARSIGAALMHLWRLKPNETLSGEIKPTRRGLLDHYPAAVSPYIEVLESDKPYRAIKYWCDAMQILATEGFIERAGEAVNTAKEMKAKLPRYDWQDVWLNERIIIIPGKKKGMFANVEERAKAALPTTRPRNLRAKSQKPRKKKEAKTG